MAGLVKRQKNGFVSLLECILAVAFLGTLCLLTVLPWQWQAERHEADMLTRELMLDLQRLREFSMGNNLAKEGRYSLYFRTGEYVLSQGYTVLKRRPYSPRAGVTVITLREFKFNEEGRPTKDMRITVSTADAGYSRTIVVAAQTGRIRAE